MEFDELLSQYQDKFNTIMEIQELIYGIDDMNIEESTEELINILDDFPFLKSKEGLTYLLKVLKFAMISRPFFNENHFLLITSLHDDIAKCFSSDELFALFSFRFFNLKLYELGMVDFSTIIKNSDRDVMNFFYFSPELQEKSPENYNKRLSNDNWLKKKIYSIGGSQEIIKNKRTNKNLNKSFQGENDNFDNHVTINETLNQEDENSSPNSSSKYTNANNVISNSNSEKTKLISNSKNESINESDPTPNSNSETLKLYNISDEERSILQKFKSIRNLGFNENRIAEVIRKDDFNGLQKILSQTNLSYESTIQKSFFERCNFVNDNSTTLLEYAAFCGSINVFKFLIQINYQNDNPIITSIQQNERINLNDNNDTTNVNLIRSRVILFLDKSEKLCKYAIAGGDYDIIHVIEEKKYLDFNINSKLSMKNDPDSNTVSKNALYGLRFNFNELFNASIQFHRNEIYDYLAENCYDDFYGDVLPKNQDNILIENFNSSILYYNFEIFMKLLPIVVKNNFINSPDSDGETPLHVAAINGHLDIVKLLCSIKGININSRANNLETPLQWAISYGHIDVVKYMLDLEGIDYSGENKVGIKML